MNINFPNINQILSYIKSEEAKIIKDDSDILLFKEVCASIS